MLMKALAAMILLTMIVSPGLTLAEGTEQGATDVLGTSEPDNAPRFPFYLIAAPLVLIAARLFIAKAKFVRA